MSSSGTTSNEDTLAVELGIWLSGLRSYLSSGSEAFSAVKEKNGKADRSRELGVSAFGLQRCALMNARLMSSGGNVSPEASLTWNVTYRDATQLGTALRDLIRLSESLRENASFSSSEWRSWCETVKERLESQTAVDILISTAESEGARYLPQALLDLVNDDSSPERAELALILPRFGVILKWLDVIGKMLEADMPLKGALLIFARVNELIFDLTSYIDHRLERYPDPETEMFASLDAASYTASIELKRVYSQELAGLIAMRPTPSIYARVETAHSLLNEGFQQMLAGFAKIIDPQTDVVKLFPNFGAKLERSVVLRQGLWNIVRVVQAAEKDPRVEVLSEMKSVLDGFMSEPVNYLFYKDTETVERFVEEIQIARQDKELVPILHRFGAFLETLFGQVNLRAVLEKHPFQN